MDLSLIMHGGRAKTKKGKAWQKKFGRCAKATHTATDYGEAMKACLREGRSDGHRRKRKRR